MGVRVVIEMEMEGKRRSAACRKRLRSCLVAGRASTATGCEEDCIAGVGTGCRFAGQTVRTTASGQSRGDGGDGEDERRARAVPRLGRRRLLWPSPPPLPLPPPPPPRRALLYAFCRGSQSGSFFSPFPWGGGGETTVAERCGCKRCSSWRGGVRKIS